MEERNWLDGATVLLTGATGRVGQRLTAVLQEAGARVRTIVLPGDPGRDRLPADVEVIEGTLSDAQVVERAVDGVDGLVHLAALMDWGAEANDALFDANVRGTYLLLDRLSRRADEIRRVVIVSSDEVYPALDVDGEIVESLTLRPYSFYGATKQLDEVLADFYRRAHGLPIAVARFSLTAAADEITRHDGWSGRLFFASGVRALMEALGRSDAVAAIDRAAPDPSRTLLLARDDEGRAYRFQFCDVRDLVEGLRVLLVSPGAVGEIVNLSGPEPFDYAEVVPRLAAAIGVDYVDVTIPGPRFNVCTNIDRARAIGYSPRYGVEEIIGSLDTGASR